MKKCSSIVWKFFDRIEEHKRCVAVVCKLCDTEYKYFGNTTNLRVHLANRHPIQWELGQNGTLDESKIQLEDADTSSTPRRRRTVKARNKNAEVAENSDLDSEEATITYVRQMHGDQNSDVEWLEEEPYQISHFETYQPKPKRKKMKYKKIKREVTSPTGLPGFYAAPKLDNTILYDEQPQKDEYSVFGEYIGNKLRKFKNARTRGNLQQLITTILWQAEYGMYDSAEAVKRVLVFSVQTPEKDSMMDFDSQVNTVEIPHSEVTNQNMTDEISIIETEVES